MGESSQLDREIYDIKYKNYFHFTIFVVKLLLSMDGNRKRVDDFFCLNTEQKFSVFSIHRFELIHTNDEMTKSDE